MTITHWDEKTRDAVFNIINLLFCCGICVEIDHTYAYEDTDEILLNFLKRQWYIGLKTGKCYMVHRTLGDHCKLVEDREDFKSVEDMTLFIKMNCLLPRTVADLRLITEGMPFAKIQQYLDELPDDNVRRVQDDARKIIPTLPTYEEYKDHLRKDFGGATCFVCNCSLPALYSVEHYGMCEKHAGVRRDYLFDILFKTKPKTPKTLIYGGPFGNAPV